MSKEEIERKLNEALSKLQDMGSVEAIAAYLTTEGLKALPWQPGETKQSITYRCPIGRYLQRELGMSAVWAGPFSCGADKPQLEVPTPRLVQRFIFAFDKGHFSELDCTIEDTINASGT